MNEPDDKNPKRRNPLVKAGVFGALGVEFIGFTLTGVFIGQWVDERYGTEPWGLLGCLLLALLAAGFHIITITKRFLEDED